MAELYEVVFEGLTQRSLINVVLAAPHVGMCTVSGLVNGSEVESDALRDVKELEALLDGLDGVVTVALVGTPWPTSNAAQVARDCMFRILHSEQGWRLELNFDVPPVPCRRWNEFVGELHHWALDFQRLTGAADVYAGMEPAEDTATQLFDGHKLGHLGSITEPIQDPDREE